MSNLRILVTVSVIIICCAPKLKLPTVLNNLPIPSPQKASIQGDISEVYIYDVGILPDFGRVIGCSYVAWAPDDSSIFIAHSIDERNFLYNFRNGKWSSLGSEEPSWITEEVERITQTRDGYSLSPDGLYCVSFLKEGCRELIISSAQDIGNFIIPTDISGWTFKRDIYNRLNMDLILGWKNNKPAWSHNGKYIAIVDRDHTQTVGIITLGGYQPQIPKPSEIEKEGPSAKVCPQCEKEYPESYSRCPKCGVKLIPKK